MPPWRTGLSGEFVAYQKAHPFCGTTPGCPRSEVHDDRYNGSNAPFYRILLVDDCVRNVKSRISKPQNRYTMNVYGTSIAILVCTLVLVSGVSAENVDNSGGYSVTPAGNLNPPSAMSPMTVGTITTGETDWYSFVVPSGKTSITTDLNWGYAPDSLTLTVIAPDGRIYLSFSRTGGLTPGTWKFNVYGENVLGSQSYNFVAY
jgi:hypothetical protein